MNDKMDKYLGKDKSKDNKKIDESEDTVGTMAYNNYSDQYGDVGVGDKGTQPLRVGRSSPSMSSRQRSWNLGFVSDVLDAEGLLDGTLKREIALRLSKLG
jgi:hypothetical protein